MALVLGVSNGGMLSCAAWFRDGARGNVAGMVALKISQGKKALDVPNPVSGSCDATA